VTNLKYTEVADGDNTSLVVTWDAAISPFCGDVLLYLVTLSSQEASNVISNSVTLTDLSKLIATFHNLRNATYNLTVAAINRAGSGMISMRMLTIGNGISTISQEG